MLFQRSDKWNYGTKCNWCQARCRDQLTDEWLQSVILDNKGDNFSDWGVFLGATLFTEVQGSIFEVHQHGSLLIILPEICQELLYAWCSVFAQVVGKLENI